MSDLKERDVVTAASIIADRYLVGLKVEDIKEAMVSAMLEYADLRERKPANGVDLKNEKALHKHFVSNNEERVAVCVCGRFIELVDNTQCKKCQAESSETKAN